MRPGRLGRRAPRRWRLARRTRSSASRPDRPRAAGARLARPRSVETVTAARPSRVFRDPQRSPSSDAWCARGRRARRRSAQSHSSRPRRTQEPRQRRSVLSSAPQVDFCESPPRALSRHRRLCSIPASWLPAERAPNARCIVDCAAARLGTCIAFLRETLRTRSQLAKDSACQNNRFPMKWR